MGRRRELWGGPGTIRTEVQNVIEGRVGGDTPGPSIPATVASPNERIRPLLDKARRPDSEGNVVDIAPVSPAVSQIVRALTRINLDRFTHIIDVAAVRRIQRTQSDPDVEAPHGRLPVTDEDIVAIPQTLADATHVITGIKLSEHRTAVGYVSKAADGSVVYLEQQVVRSRRRLIIRAIRKYPPETTSESIRAGLETSARRGPWDVPILTEIAPDLRAPRGDPFTEISITISGHADSLDAHQKQSLGSREDYEATPRSRIEANPKGSGPSGTFSVSDWSGYPAIVPRPPGPFRILHGVEYHLARADADNANEAIRRERGIVGLPVDVHEIQPVKFGGSPTDPANKVILPRAVHRRLVTPWWNRLQKDLGG
jgi:hypothetical protein